MSCHRAAASSHDQLPETGHTKFNRAGINFELPPICMAAGRRAMLEGRCHCGQVGWRFDGVPDHATACNCSMCHRRGALWGYGHEGVDVHVDGETAIYVWGDGSLGTHFCPACGIVAYWRGLSTDAEGRRRMGINLRLAEPEAVGDIPVRHLDGFDTWEAVSDGRCVKDMWF
jgi:hypothetical protein